jgi:hypothetical protein
LKDFTEDSKKKYDK